ncbi:DUF1153 domain-containing protein [Nitrosophilus labii]|uniref:DUF1153 domain-containing protein n=1 Tax=Nitrosophilus labii TaxID=2706014 RepID=UPI0018DA1797|nr:DUF1153 domain-containing protein [Nitrosophilus labii]
MEKLDKNPEEEIKRFIAKKKAKIVMDIFQGKVTVTEVSRRYDLTSGEIEEWMEEARKGMENQLRSRPKDIAALYEEKIKEMKAVIDELTLENIALKKYDFCRGKEEVMQVQSEMRDEGYLISITKLCHLFGIVRRSFYYKSVQRTPRVDEERVRKVKEKIKEFPTYGYR